MDNTIQYTRNTADPGRMSLAWTIQGIQDQGPDTVHQRFCACPLQHVRTNFRAQCPVSIKKQMFPLNREAVRFSLILILTGTSFCSTPLQVRSLEVYVTDRSAEWSIRATLCRSCRDGISLTAFQCMRKHSSFVSCLPLRTNKLTVP